MIKLNKSLKKTLRKTILEARAAADDAVGSLFTSLGVALPEPPPYLDQERADLRLRLRALALGFGDPAQGGLKSEGEPMGDPLGEVIPGASLDRLAGRIAFEHWHRMLFARFLAENELLMFSESGGADPDDQVPVTFAECEALAEAQGASSGWELAAKLAYETLAPVFRASPPVLGLRLPAEHQMELERLLADLPREIFTASDGLGWAYQHWNEGERKRFKASEAKIPGLEQFAATQLHTDPYMVQFLLDNTLGAWWALRSLAPADLEAGFSEKELRHKASLPGMPLKFLRFFRDESGSWAPINGAFDGWPDELSEFKLLDPCCGSGSFLVAAFEMLVPMRMELEGLQAGEAVDAVLRDNLLGLDIDGGCLESASLALAMAAWLYPGAGGHRPLPELGLASSGQPAGPEISDWLILAGGDAKTEFALESLHGLFAQAPVLGSLINTEETLRGDVFFDGSSELWKASESAAARAIANHGAKGGSSPGDYALFVAARAAREAARAAAILSGRYHLIASNFPFLSSAKQCEALRKHCQKRHPSSKANLAVAMLERSLEFCYQKGLCAVVMPELWLTQSSYKNFRSALIRTTPIPVLATLGPLAFEAIPINSVSAMLMILSHNAQGPSVLDDSLLIDPGDHIRGLEAQGEPGPFEKAEALMGGRIWSANQAKQLGNLDCRVSLKPIGSGDFLELSASSYFGLATGDLPRMRFCFWEFPDVPDEWEMFHGGVRAIGGFRGSSRPDAHYGGMSWLLRWSGGKGPIEDSARNFKRGLAALGKRGVIARRMGKITTALYMGDKFILNSVVIIPNDENLLPAIWCYCASPEYSSELDSFSKGLQASSKAMIEVPFDKAKWSGEAQKAYPFGLPEPFSDDPTQWIFHGHPCGSVIWDDSRKRTAKGPSRVDNIVLQVAMARLLGYKWPAERNAGMALAQEQREMALSSKELDRFASPDGVVCVPAVRGEAAADVRLREILAAAYGEAWSVDVEARLLMESRFTGKSLENWLRDGFFTQHCKLFQKRPFIWQVWDGRGDGFSALVNYHKFDHKLLEALIYKYLGDWIARQKHDYEEGVEGAWDRWYAADAMKKRLEQILEGEAPLDIFVRWKPLELQPIGWNPDIGDGVRLNLRPFATAPGVGRKGSGLMRDDPEVDWDVDKGQETEPSPWHHLHKGARVNDHHLTLAEKKAARG